MESLPLALMNELAKYCFPADIFRLSLTCESLKDISSTLPFLEALEEKRTKFHVLYTLSRCVCLSASHIWVPGPKYTLKALAIPTPSPEHHPSWDGPFWITYGIFCPKLLLQLPTASQYEIRKKASDAQLMEAMLAFDMRKQKAKEFCRATIHDWLHELFDERRWAFIQNYFLMYEPVKAPTSLWNCIWNDYYPACVTLILSVGKERPDLFEVFSTFPIQLFGEIQGHLEAFMTILNSHCNPKTKDFLMESLILCNWRHGQPEKIFRALEPISFHFVLLRYVIQIFCTDKIFEDTSIVKEWFDIMSFDLPMQVVPLPFWIEWMAHHKKDENLCKVIHQACAQICETPAAFSNTEWRPLILKIIGLSSLRRLPSISNSVENAFEALVKC